MVYDTIVIGSGPGGYVAAIRCAQLGMKTAIIERYNTLGGTCLNVGCIPSKALLDSSEHYHNAEKNFTNHGIDLSGLKLNMPQMIARKNKVVADICKGVEFLMKKNKIDVHVGHGTLTSATTVEVVGEKTVSLEAKNIILATGSKPITPASFNYDKKRIITSTEALDIAKLPKRMSIIGAGVIGLELGSVFARLGTQVEVIEYAGSAIAGMDKDLGKELTRSLKKLGMKFHFNYMVKEVTATARKTKLVAEHKDSKEALVIDADYCLVAIGRRPYTDNLGLDKAGVKMDERGRIEVNEHLQTSVPNIYAIGDVVKGAMLAHKAEEEGVFVAETLAGQKPHIHYHLIPGVVYTWPEVAAVGLTEKEVKEAGTPYKVGKFPFRALGRAKASGDLEGMVKIIAHKETDEVLGVHMIGARCADIIAEAVTAMEYRASAEDIARMSHAHPTFTEAVKEAAMAATENRAIHM